jgi:hypothetical protein
MKQDSLLGVFVDREDRGDIFLRNVGVTFSVLHGDIYADNGNPRNQRRKNLKSYKLSRTRVELIRT